MENFRREVKFLKGYDCMNFPCKADKPCTPENSHGKHGMDITFYLHGEKGTTQFKLTTGWFPYYSPKSKIDTRDVARYNNDGLYPMPIDLGYHSLTPYYEGQSSMGKCSVLGGRECFYDGSGLNAQDAFYVLVNCGEEALWKFLEDYYKTVFEDAPYPEVGEYGK